MKSQLRAEFLKQRTTRTTIGMIGAMVGLVLVAVALHAFGLPVTNMRSHSDQLNVLADVGTNLGSLFAALLGAMVITGEVRHGTIRPTLLGSPQRGRVVAAKAVAVALTGIAFGALATVVAAGSGTLFLNLRGVSTVLDAGDYVQLIVGGALAAALWAVIGLGVGAIVRSQVPTMVGILVWVLFVESILNESVPSVAKYAPAALGRAIAGVSTGALDTPALGVVLLAVYAAAAIAVGWLATTERDFA